VLTPQEFSAIALSLRVALLAVLCALPFAIAAAWLLARGRFRGKTLFDALVHLPLLMPPVLSGYVLLVLFGILLVIGALDTISIIRYRSHLGTVANDAAIAAQTAACVYWPPFSRTPGT